MKVSFDFDGTLEFGDVQEDLESLDKNQLRMLYCNLVIKQKEKQID